MSARQRRRSSSFATRLLLALLATALLGQSADAEPINWRGSLDAAKVEAGSNGKLILLHFYTESCGPCKKLERDVFSQPQIGAAMERDYVPVKINADNAPALAHAYDINRVPTEVVITSQGNVVKKLSCPLEPNAYGAQLANVSQYYRQQAAGHSGLAQAPINSAYAGLKIGQPNHQPVALAQPKLAPANAMATAPSMMQNPYVTPRSQQPPAAQQVAAPTLPSQPIITPTPPQQEQVAANTPTMPAKAMSNSYGDRYAAIVAPTSTPKPTATANTTRPAAPVVEAPIAKSTVVEATGPALVATVETDDSITPTPSTPPALADPVVAATQPQAEGTLAAAEPAPTSNTTEKPAGNDAWPPQLPPGTPPLAFDGYCPISLQQAQKWVRGNKTFGAIHRGRTYLFVGDAQRQQFLANPDAYSPVFSGNDPVLMLDENKMVAGDRKFGFEYRKAFYLFSSKETMERFARKPDTYSASVRQAMNRMDGSAGGTMRR